MTSRHLWVTAGLAFLLGCGTADLHPMQPSNGRQGDTASAASGGTAADAKAKTPATVACAGTTLTLHGDHTSCDQDDADVVTGAVPTIDPTPTVDPSSVTTQPLATPTAMPTSTTGPNPTPSPTASGNSGDPKLVEFHIAPGTGNKPWNTAATAVTVKIGQTLRLINDDTVTHRMHTGGAPCPHGNNFTPGNSADCVITKTIDTVAKPGAVYDHIAGPTALFYIRAVP